MQFVKYHFKTQNILHTLFIVMAMILLLMSIGYLIVGISGALFALFFLMLMFVLTPRLSPNLILRLYGAQKIEPILSEGLFALADNLRGKAGLKNLPELYYLPSMVLNSFTVGDKEDYKIVLSDGLLRSLSTREIYAVLAHEISHVKNNDLQVMAFADVMSRVTALLSLTGVITMLFALPLAFIGEISLPVPGLLVLIFAPNITALLQLALSRTREFTADQRAAELTEDPMGLASALAKIDAVEKHWAQRLLMPHYKLTEPSLLRTHPLNEERIARLQKLVQLNDAHNDAMHKLVPEKAPGKKPRHHLRGYWY